MMQYNLNRQIALLLLVFLLSACTPLKKLDQKLGETIFKDDNHQSEMDNNSKDNNQNTENNIIPEEVDKAVKEKIDKWLTDNDLNRYGDPIGTFYTGGTPLFNEETGETLERFEYILEKIPDILEKI